MKAFQLSVDYNNRLRHHSVFRNEDGQSFSIDAFSAERIAGFADGAAVAIIIR